MSSASTQKGSERRPPQKGRRAASGGRRRRAEGRQQAAAAQPHHELVDAGLIVHKVGADVDTPGGGRHMQRRLAVLIHLVPMELQPPPH